jgi:hypothetical protein
MRIKAKMTKKKRRLNAGQVRDMAAMYMAYGTRWCHPSSDVQSTQSSRDYSRLKYWGFMERGKDKKEDGNSGGYWRVTYKGERWLHGEIEVPLVAWEEEYEPHKWRFWQWGNEMVHKNEFFGPFDYREVRKRRDG